MLGAAAGAGRDPERIRSLGRSELDLLNPDQINGIVDELRPRAVINCAVFQPVDLCETEPAAAFAVNATGVGTLARACRRVGARLAHLSTDYVFGGELRRPYRETDLPAPRSVYAASKLAGEHLALAASEMHMVVRTSAVYGDALPGHGTAPFVERMLERARAGQTTRVVNDQIVSPTNADDLAAGIWALLGCGATGLYHVANRGEGSWFELAEILFEATGQRAALSPTTAEEYGAPAPRSAYTALDTQRLRRLGLSDLPPWREALDRHLRQRHADLFA